MIKKLAITGAAAALFLGSAAGVFAHETHHSSAPLPTTNVTNYGSIDNTSVNLANTGLNLGSSSSHDRRDSRGGSVTTGAAVAVQSTDNEINTVAGCGCSTGGNTNVTNYGSVSNQSWNVANTGLNLGGSVHTGSATAGQDVYNVIGTGVSSQ